MPKPKAEQKMIAIEPATMSVPTMDRASITFAWFLDRVTIEVDEDDGAEWVCASCGAPIMAISEGDSLRVVLQTSLAHGC